MRCTVELTISGIENDILPQEDLMRHVANVRMWTAATQGNRSKRSAGAVIPWLSFSIVLATFAVAGFQVGRGAKRTEAQIARLSREEHSYSRLTKLIKLWIDAAWEAAQKAESLQCQGEFGALSIPYAMVCTVRRTCQGTLTPQIHCCGRKIQTLGHHCALMLLRHVDRVGPQPLNTFGLIGKQLVLSTASELAFMTAQCVTC